MKTKVLEDAKDMLSIFEGALSSCHDRGHVDDKAWSKMAIRSQRIRRRLTLAQQKEKR